MARALSTVALAIVGVWLVAHVLWIGPVQAAVETTALWALAIAASSLGVAAIVLLVVGVVLGPRQPVWLRFVRAARTGAAVLGAALIVFGLLYYRQTEPRGEIHWVVLGMVVLAGAGLVHWWVGRVER